MKNIKFSQHIFGLSLSLKCFGEISPQSLKSAYPINSLVKKLDVFISKTKCEILVHKGLLQTTCHAGRLSHLIKPQTNGTTGPPSICDNRSRYITREKHLIATRFLSRSVEYNSGRQHNIMGKYAKVQGKTSAKRVKGGKRTAEKQELTDSLRNTRLIFK